MKRLCVLSAAVVLAGSIAFADPIADPAVALEKAVQIEQTTDNAAEAEAIYRQIIADYQRRESAAEEARYRLGALLLEQGKEEEGRNVLLLLRYGPQRGVSEWQMKAMELLGGADPLGMNPFGGTPGFGFGDPFGGPGGNPFGSDPGMMGGGMDPMMGGAGMMGGPLADDPAMGMERPASTPMRSLEQIREADKLLTELELESSRKEQQIRANHPMVKVGRMSAGDVDANDPLVAAELRREEHLRQLIGLLRLQPDSPRPWISLGEKLLERNDLADAASVYQQALQLKPPSDVEARIQAMLGQIAMKQGHDDEAQLHFTHAIIADDRVMAAFMGLAAIAEKRGDTHSAIRNLHHVLAWEPNNREARVMLQRIDPEAESAPAPRTEEELAAARELAMNEGRFEDALTLEEKRLQLRIDALNPWVDKLSFSGLAKEWVEKHKPSEDRINEAINAVDSRLKLLGNDDAREWRFFLVMAELAEASGDPARASSWIQTAMHQYPNRTYVDPAKHSFYQHLLNKVAAHWWSSGRDMAIQNVIHTLENDKRLQTLNVDWWLDRIAQDGGDADFQRRFLERVIQAYDKRAKKFPDQAGIIAAEKQILRRRIQQLGQ